MLCFHGKWSEAELRQARHMQHTFRRIVEAMGGSVAEAEPGPETGDGISTAGHDCRNFFATFRDLVASGFWTNVGMDLQYRGNTYVAEWKGCPPEVLSRLGFAER